VILGTTIGPNVVVHMPGTSVTETEEATTDPSIGSTGVTLSTCAIDPNLNTLVSFVRHNWQLWHCELSNTECL
jgi:hypothetical protein